ncbi:hypothetical protein E2P81_ATG10796 [Venturia nashicola]|nr:hypothetical protein E2P81_ATG10796 [Venturia nashicola]
MAGLRHLETLSKAGFTLQVRTEHSTQTLTVYAESSMKQSTRASVSLRKWQLVQEKMLTHDFFNLYDSCTWECECIQSLLHIFHRELQRRIASI